MIKINKLVEILLQGIIIIDLEICHLYILSYKRLVYLFRIYNLEQFNYSSCILSSLYILSKKPTLCYLGFNPIYKACKPHIFSVSSTSHVYQICNVFVNLIQLEDLRAPSPCRGALWPPDDFFYFSISEIYGVC